MGAISDISHLAPNDIHIGKLLPIQGGWKSSSDPVSQEPFWFIAFPTVTPCCREHPLRTQWTKKASITGTYILFDVVLHMGGR
jgi:hypothetical protein